YSCHGPCAMDHVITDILNPISPQRAALWIKPRGFEDALYGRIARMNFCADAVDAAFLRIFEKRADQSATDSLSPPLRRDEQCDDIHCFSAKFGTPFIRTVGVAAERSFVTFGDNHDSPVHCLHHVFEYAAGVLKCSFRADVRKQFTGQFTQLVHVSGFGSSNLKWLYAHIGYPAALL